MSALIDYCESIQSSEGSPETWSSVQLACAITDSVSCFFVFK